MSVEQMRRAVAGVYESYKWKDKVAKMSDKQIIAIYYKMLNAKELK